MDTSIFKSIANKKIYTRAGFQSLTIEEKKWVGIIGLGLLLVMYYFLIWSPLSDGVDSLQDKITQDQKTLLSLIQANNKINKEKNIVVNKSNERVPLLTLLDREAKINAWQKYLVNMKQIDTEIEVSLVKINFDDFIGGLEDIGNKYDVQIDKVDLIRLNNSENVQATVLFQQKNGKA